MEWSSRLFLALALVVFGIGAQPGAAQPVSALSGTVSSDNEGRMQGVVVTAKRADSTVSVSVVSDESGQYRFPVGRLAEGRYTLTIRAGGYDLDHPETIDLTDGVRTRDLHL